MEEVAESCHATANISRLAATATGATAEPDRRTNGCASSGAPDASNRRPRRSCFVSVTCSNQSARMIPSATATSGESWFGSPRETRYASGEEFVNSAAKRSLDVPELRASVHAPTTTDPIEAMEGLA